MYARLWSRIDVLFADEECYRKALFLVPLFYYFLEFMSFGAIARYPEFLVRGISNPHWGTAWLSLAEGLGIEGLVASLALFFVGVTCGALWYRHRIARIAAFLAVFQFQALMISIDGQANEYYIPLFASFFFIFLPTFSNGTPVSERSRRTFLQLFWAAQAYVLATYAASGFFKLGTTFSQVVAGEASFFSPDAAALFAAEWLSRYDTTTILGEFIIQHPVAGWAGLLAVLYVLTCSIFIPFIPELHRVWAFALLLFHLSTVLSIGLLFWYNTFFVLLFLAASPFAPRAHDWRAIARALPIFGWLYKGVRMGLSRRPL